MLLNFTGHSSNNYIYFVFCNHCKMTQYRRKLINILLRACIHTVST